MTPDQLTAIIDRMGVAPWKCTDGDIRCANDRLVHGRENFYPTAMDDDDVDGVIALRNHASALNACAKLLKECREPCPISEDGLKDLRERIDAALKRLEEIK